EDALLHPRPAGRRDNDDRQVLVDGELDRSRELLADDRAHAAPEEAELEHGEHGRLAADRPDAADDRLVRRGLLRRPPHPLPVFLGVLEGERMGRRQPRLALLERAGVDELPDALARRDPERIVALRAHAPAALHLGAIDDLLAGVALDPQPFGDDDLAAARLLFPLEPGHRDLPPRLAGGRPQGLPPPPPRLPAEPTHTP